MADENDVIEKDDDALEFPVAEDDDFEVEVVDDAEESETEEETEEEAPAAKAEEEDTDDEEVAPSDDDDLTEEDEAEINSYSKNVKKRILREIRAKKRVEEELTTVKTQAGQFIGRLSEEGKKTFSRAEALQKQYDDMQDSYATLLEQSFTEKAQFLQEKLKRAKDEGDTGVEVAALSELQTLSTQKAELANISRNIKSARAERKPAENVFEKVVPAAQTQQAPKVVPPTPRGQKWKESRSWYGKQKFSEVTEFAHVVDRKLFAEGLNPNSKEYFVELDRRLSKRFPELYKTNKPKNSSVAPVSSGVGKSASSKGKVTLNRSDLNRMRAFGLDPSNKAHLREWAKSKGAA